MTRPGKIVCVGRNYRDHAREMGNPVPSEPLLFLKPPTSLIPNGSPIILPSMSRRVEYEGEIGVIIGRVLRRATAHDTLPAVAAIVAVNDVTARDLQHSDGQWTRAKGFDTFCPLGNGIAPGDDLASLVVMTRVNGAQRQRARASDMVFPIPHLLAYISGIMTLEPGDLVATGTPAGVGPLAAGDTVEVEVAAGNSRSCVRNPVISDH